MIAVVPPTLMWVAVHMLLTQQVMDDWAERIWAIPTSYKTFFGLECIIIAGRRE